jgi:hypothetical protein
MQRVNYKIFVPREIGINYIEVDKDKFLVEEIVSTNIFYGEDKVIYYLYLVVPEDLGNERRNPFSHKTFKGCLSIDNIPYFINGEGEVLSSMKNYRTFSTEYKIMFTVNNAHKTVNNLREEVKVTRNDLIDLED